PFHTRGPGERRRAAGVPAAPVMANWELFTDNHLNSRDYFVRVSHPDVGMHWFSGFLWKFEKTPARVQSHAPLFAEHNDAVFSGLLGMDNFAVAALYAADATADEPQYANGPSL